MTRLLLPPKDEEWKLRERQGLSQHRTHECPSGACPVDFPQRLAGMATGAQGMPGTRRGQLLGRHVWQYLGPTPPSSWKLGLVSQRLHSSRLPLKTPGQYCGVGKV